MALAIICSAVPGSALALTSSVPMGRDCAFDIIRTGECPLELGVVIVSEGIRVLDLPFYENGSRSSGDIYAGRPEPMPKVSILPSMIIGGNIAEVHLGDGQFGLRTIIPLFADMDGGPHNDGFSGALSEIAQIDNAFDPVVLAAAYRTANHNLNVFYIHVGSELHLHRLARDSVGLASGDCRAGGIGSASLRGFDKRPAVLSGGRRIRSGGLKLVSGEFVGRVRLLQGKPPLLDGLKQGQKASEAEQQLTARENNHPKRPSGGVLLGGEIALFALGAIGGFWIGYEALRRARNASMISIGLLLTPFIAGALLVSSYCFLMLLLNVV
ncbi:hypothetical protein [Sphingomonas caeni]|uniref:hypothetical protein n=1 Tax=Sphingomonas caeni TaxID=2984949 RepID=UPI0022303A8C|nr:hypothetical protein [Sphingomonas caeni]